MTIGTAATHGLIAKLFFGTAVTGSSRLYLMARGLVAMPHHWPLVLLLVALAVSAFYAFTFRVGADELGIVLRFGKVERHEPPGLHFRLPYPINEVYLPKVTRQNIIEIGFRSAPAREALSHRRL